MNQKLAVVIPMYNEEQNARRCVDVMLEAIKENPAVYLYVVDDGSSDNTRSILLDLLKEKNAGDKFRFVPQTPNGGYGQACLAGARQAYKDGITYGLFMDSDLTNSPSMIAKFYDLLATNKYDMVKGSRYIEGGGMDGVPQHRQWITILGNKIASILFGIGIKDCTNGFRAVRLDMMVNENYRERGFPVILEELYAFKKKGARFAEIPYILTSRQQGQGVSKFNYKPSIFWAYLKYALRAMTVRYKERTGNGV